MIASLDTFVCGTNAYLVATHTKTAAPVNRVVTIDARILVMRIRADPMRFAQYRTIEPPALVWMEWWLVQRQRLGVSARPLYLAQKTESVPRVLLASPKCVVHCAPTTLAASTTSVAIVALVSRSVVGTMIAVKEKFVRDWLVVRAVDQIAAALIIYPALISSVWTLVVWQHHVEQMPNAIPTNTRRSVVVQ